MFYFCLYFLKTPISQVKIFKANVTKKWAETLTENIFFSNHNRMQAKGFCT